MAYYFSEPSRTFGEYLLVPGYSSSECVPTAVSLKTPLVKYRKGEEACPLEMNIPMVSAIMQSVSGEKLAIALAKQGGVSFIYGSQTIEQEADMVRRVKAYKKGFVTSDSNLPPEATLGDVLDLKTRTGHSTVAITDDGTAHGKLLGIVASRDYRLSRMTMDLKVTEFMTPLDKLVTAPATTSLHDCNDIIWDNKINSLPLIDEEGHLQYMVFRKDYDSHKENVNELLDENKSYIVGAGINTRDFAERVPALVEAGVDVLCIDSSEGFSEWQSRTIAWIRENYGDKVKVGAGNVVDREGFLFVMLGRYFARFDESPTNKLRVGGNYVKEYWGEGSNRARNWQRYDLGGAQKLSFEEGVDSYVPYAGPLADGVQTTLYKVRSTMCNCGALSIPELQEKARLTVVSSTSIVEGGSHDVILKNGPQNR